MVEEERTSIGVFQKTKSRLDKIKLCSDESYDNEINRLLDKLEA